MRIEREVIMVSHYRRASKTRGAGYRDERVVRWVVRDAEGRYLTTKRTRRAAQQFISMNAQEAA